MSKIRSRRMIASHPKSVGSSLMRSDGESLDRDIKRTLYQDAKNRANTFEVWSRKRLGEIRQRIEELEK